MLKIRSEGDIKDGWNPDGASFADEEGIIISPNQALILVREIEEKYQINKNKESVETCQTCHIKPATEMHTCPYATEINDCDNECNCCDGCRHECMQDI